MTCPLCGKNRFTTVRLIDSSLRAVPAGLDRATHVLIRVEQCSSCGLLRSVDLSDASPRKSVSFAASASKVHAAGTRSVSSTDELSLLCTNPPASLLDVGCGAGQFLLRAANAGFDTNGIDPDSASVDFVTHTLSLRARQGSLEVLRANERFDVITLLGVLEHIAEPVPFLREVSTHLNAGGELLVGVPNSASLNRRISSRSRHDWDMFLEPGHLYHYNPGTLQLIGERAGLRMLRRSTSTITIRGKVPFLPSRIPTIERLIRSATVRSDLANRAYVAGLRLLDRANMGDAVLAVFTPGGTSAL